MYTKQKIKKTSIKINKSVQGEPIEQKIERIVNNNEPITDGAPLLFTERKEGVLPAYNPRTDRFEIAIDAMDKVTKDKMTKREERLKGNLTVVEGGNEGAEKGRKDGGAEPTQGTPKTTD